MKKIMIGAILLLSMAAFGGFGDQLISPGVQTGAIPAGNVRDTVLFDTSAGVAPGAYGIVSSALTDPSLGGFRTAGADDFTIADCAWEITRVRAYGAYADPFNVGQAGPATSVNVYILPKSGSLPTSTNLASIAIYAGTNLAYTDLNDGDFEIEIPGGVVLQAGSYWLVVQANIELLAVGHWAWTESSLTPNSGTTNGDESAWFQSAAGYASPVTGTATCVGSWGTRVTSCQMTRNPDTLPPADRDNAFQIEGNVLTAGFDVSPPTVVTTEDGATNGYFVTLTAPPSPGETVTVTPFSNDATEGTVSGALNFTDANWDTAQFVTVTPGASGDGNDGNVAYTIDNNASSDDPSGCYDGATAASVNATNNNIDGIATIIVDPSSNITVSEDGTVTQVVTIEAGPDVTPASDVTVGLTNNSATEISLSVPSVTLTAGNGYSTTVTITGVSDNVKEVTNPFTVTTNSSTSMDAAYNGVNPDDISGQVTDSNTVGVTVTPSATPLVTTEAGATATISYVLDIQPTANVQIALHSDDAAEAAVSPSTLTFTSANWNTPQVVTVTGQNDFIDDGNVAYSIIADPTTSTDPFWNGVTVADVDGINNDDADTAGFNISPTSGLVTSETGTVTSFTVVCTSQPVFNLSIDFRSGDTTEGLVGTAMGGPFSTTVTLTFTSANWNVPQTVYVQGQDDDIRDDGNILYTIFSENVASGDPVYNAITDGAVSDVTVTNNDDADAAGLTVTPLTLTMAEDGAAQVFTVRLNSEPTVANVTMNITSGDTTEATVSPSSLSFNTGNWNVPQNVTVTPVHDLIVDTDQTFDVTVGPASGGNYAGLTETVSVTVTNIDECTEMTLDVEIGQPIVAYGASGCTFDLYKTNGSNNTSEWTLLGTFTIPPSGWINTGEIAESDCVYLTTISGTFVILTVRPYATVPTLGEWGMIALVALMAAAGIFYLRRRTA